MTETMPVSTAKTQALTQEIASVLLDWRVLRYGNILLNQDDTLLQRGGGKGLRIYDELERDAHAFAVLDKRKKAVTARPWDVAAGGDGPLDQEAADIVKTVLGQIQYNRICREQLDATLKGYAVGEVMWGLRGSLMGITDVIAREQRRFVFDVEGQPRLLTPQDMLKGIELPDKKFVVHRHGAKDGSPYGLGIGSRLFWPVYFKRKDISFWMIFLDKFGSPTPVGKYPAGTLPQDQQLLMNAVQAIAQESGIIIPEGMVIELLEAQRSGDQGSYERLARYMDEQISEAVLGETLTTNVSSGGGGNRALGEVHKEVSDQLTKDDSDMLCDTHNETLVKWIVEYNMPGAAVNLPKVQRDFGEPEDLQKRASRDLTLRQMGADFTDVYIRETYGDGVIWKTGTPLPAKVGGPPASDGADASFAELRLPADARSNIRDQDQLVAAAGKFGARWRDLIGPRVESIQTLLDETGDLVTFRERLAELLDAEPPAGVVKALADGRFAAQLSGRLSKQK
jgi:phage gp29-like protein